MLDLLADRPRTTGELAAAFPKLSRFAVMKHLAVLQKAGLLVVNREGRHRWNAINPVPLRDVLRRWMSKHEQAWSDVILNIRDAAESDATSERKKLAKPPASGETTPGDPEGRQ